MIKTFKDCWFFVLGLTGLVLIIIYIFMEELK